ncbi:MAG: response regulator transcription factor [Tissierellia bacterium]|nr:response regulator transcription factor [Tissierellia bacterium]
MSKRILIVGDHITDIQLLIKALNRHNFDVLRATTGSEAIRILKSDDIMAVILNPKLPDTYGFEILKSIRNCSTCKHIPVLIISVDKDVTDAIIGLEMGADDYITAPFYPRELVARLNAIIRRIEDYNIRTQSIITCNDIKIDLNRRIIRKNNRIIELSFKEFEILYLLILNSGNVLPRQTILNKIGGMDYNPNTRVVDMHISSIRKKLGDIDIPRRYIDTVSGIGYRFKQCT